MSKLLNIQLLLFRDTQKRSISNRSNTRVTKQLNRRVTRKWRNPISVGNNPVECNSHNKNKYRKQCRIWSFRRCIDGKDIGSKECQSQGDPETKDRDKESRSDCLGAAGEIMLTILVFYICRI